MIDISIVQNCDKILAGLSETLELESEGQNNTGRVEEIREEISGIMQAIISTAAITLTGLAAKASLYLTMQDEGLAMSLCSDAVAMASVVSQLLAA